jgi:hypothetical protein
MNLKNNPTRRTALVWTGITATGIFIIFLPGIIGMDGFNGGFALAFGGGFVAILGFIAAIIYFRLATRLDRITRKEDILAHWTYSPGEWKTYTEEEHKEDAADKKGVFIMVMIISVIVGIVFWLVVRDNPLLIAGIILGIIAVTGIAAFTSSWTTYLNNKRRHGEAFIHLDGVYLNRQLHIWKGIGTRLEGAVYEDDGTSLPRIRFDYSAPGRSERYYYSARIPVPPGEEESAKRILSQIAAAHLPAKDI